MGKIKTAISKIKRDLFERRETSSFYYIALFSLTALFLVLMLGNRTRLLRTLGRSLGFLILVILAYSFIDWNLDVTERFKFWKEKREIDQEVNFRMEETTKLVERASSGEKLSQEKLSEKLRNTFLIKLKDKRNLSEDQVQELLENQDKFRRVVRDEAIADFILNGFEDEKVIDEDEKRWFKKIGLFSSSKEKMELPKKEIERIIRRIERWS